MSGWDTSSRPTWDPQDGPEDGTQAFSVPDNGVPNGSAPNGSAPNGSAPNNNSGADDRWPQPAGGGWGGTGEFEQRQPGASLPESGWPGSARQESARQESARPDYGRMGDYGSVDDYGNPNSSDYGRTGEYSRDFPRRDPGRSDFSSYSTYAGQPDQAEQPPASVNRGDADLAARMDPALQDFFAPTTPDPRYSSGRPGSPARPSGPNRLDQTRLDQNRFDQTGFNQAGFNQAGFDHNGFEQNGFEQNGFEQNGFDQGPGLPATGLPGPALNGSSQPGQGWADQGWPDQGWSDQRPQPSRLDGGRGPQRLGRASGPFEGPGGYPAPGVGRSNQGRPGQDGAAQNGAAQDRAAQNRPGQDRPGGGRRIAQDEVLPASRGKRVLAISAVAVVVLAGGSYLALHKSSSTNNAAGDTAPTFSPSASAAASTKPKAKDTTKKSGVTSNASSTGGYVLSTPATAAGYPIGTDPHFLATATTTVAAFEKTAIGGGGGKVTGSPVSASYTLPDAQTIEFVGYQGTFDPTTVMANLKSYGSSESTYPAGKNGGDLACANTIATATTPSGAVCVWVTKSTLGFTMFFTQADGPETLNSAQAKGAQDTVALRSSVETLKS